MSLGWWDLREALPEGPDFIGDHLAAKRELQRRREDAASRIWRESLPAFEEAVSAHGYAGWDPVLFRTYGPGGYPVARFTEHALAQDRGQWLPSEPYDGPSAERMARQFDRWELVEAADALGLTEDAETLRQPCPEKGFDRRRWTLAAERVQARIEAEREEGETAAKLAEIAGAGVRNHAFAALATLKGRLLETGSKEGAA